MKITPKNASLLVRMFHWTCSDGPIAGQTYNDDGSMSDNAADGVLGNPDCLSKPDISPLTKS